MSVGFLVLVVLVALAAGVVGTLRGGTRRGFGEEDLHGVRLVPAALGLQVLLLLPGVGSLGVARSLGWLVLAVSLVMLLLFARANARLPGVPLLALGLLCNLLVVMLNLGMPINGAAMQRAGIAPPPAAERRLDAVHLREIPATRLKLLDRRIAVRPLHTALSFGDVAQLAGLFLVVQGLMLAAAERSREEALVPGPPGPGIHPPGSGDGEL